MRLQNAFVSFVIPAVLAGSAAAQMVTMPAGMTYPVAPVSLPGPVTGPTAIIKIELPSPRLDPALAVALNPVPSVAAFAVLPSLPVPMIPSRPVVPVMRPDARRENVRHPLSPLFPVLRVQLDAKKEKTGAPAPLDGFFDGRKTPEKKPVVEPGTVFTLPESDLEAEIGVATLGR